MNADGKVPLSLSEEDYLAILGIMRQLYQCQVREDLNRCLENSIMPLLGADTCGYAWANTTEWEKMVNPAEALGMVGIPPSQWPWCNKVHSYLVSFFECSSKSNRFVIAHDVDIPREELQRELATFAKDHPEFNPSQLKGFSTFLSNMALFDRVNHIAAGFQRYTPNDKLWTRREIRLMELLHPTLFSVIRRAAIQEQVKTYQALIAALAETGAPMALVREDGRVLYRNAAFSSVVAVDAGGVLPQSIRDLVEQQVVRMSPDKVPESGTAPLAFFPQGETVYRLGLTQLFPDENGTEPAWLLRLNPADDPYSAMHRTLQTSGLTPREVEVAILAGDGLEDGDIAQRLFISPATLKNHFKSIYKKLDVHSRTQLVHRLQGTTKGRATP
ncbi:helix-turn-helix transcriptional regulator [Nitrospina watsonii]|uniref:HTH luxR-type domain-containing protein n=1 Tax=Nitrospina watsonii TaxID=1323948 RepID=A0ABM9HF74_9BACT|nr:helix-turn-helix transcriptional regulator [Nitrospina watsonii]CAI2718918.1 HTH luxR-type domain-containing protein [Nitrospina watsonii]